MLLFSSPFRARTAEASARSNSPLLRVSQPRLQNIYFGRFVNGSSGKERVRHSNSKDAFVRKKTRVPLPNPSETIPKLFLRLVVKARKRPSRGGGSRGSGMRFRSTARNRRVPRMIVHIVSAFVRRHT